MCKHLVRSVVAAIAIAATAILFPIPALPAVAEPAIGTPNQIFRFRPGRTMFYADYHENLDKARLLAKEVRDNIDRIRSGEIIIRVEGYATSYGSPRSNLKAAANRSNQVKSYLILYAGVKEENFLTKNFADTWRGMADIAAVAYLEPVTESEKSLEGESHPVSGGETTPENPAETSANEKETNTDTPVVVPVPVTENKTTEKEQSENPAAEKETETGNPVAEKEINAETPVVVVPVPVTENKATEKEQSENPAVKKETETENPAAEKETESENKVAEKEKDSGAQKPSEVKDREEETTVKVKVERVPWMNGKGTFYPKIAIKTNLLALAGVMADFKYYTPLPNLEAEWYFARRWSLAGTGAFAKWPVGGKFFGTSAWSIEPRVWIWGDARYRWIYAGIYGQWGDFDNQRMHIDDFGHTGAFAGTGISVGAALPMTDRLMLEVGLRAGWQWRETDVYSWEPPHYYYDYTNRGGKWGLTGAKISLMYRFGKRR